MRLQPSRPAFAPLETVVYLDNAYWGEHKPAEVVAPRVEIPSLSPDQTAWEAVRPYLAKHVKGVGGTAAGQG